MTFGRHPNKEIRAAFEAAVAAGIEVHPKRRGHGWGHLRCPVDGGREPIWSTPRVPEWHAAKLETFVDQHRHTARPTLRSIR